MKSLKDYKHIKYSVDELYSLLIFSGIISIMFTFTFFRFEISEHSLFYVFFLFFAFLLVTFALRLLVMKLISIYHGFNLYIRHYYFDKYGLRTYDSLSAFKHRVERKVVKTPLTIGKNFSPTLRKIQYEPNKDFKGIPSPLVSIILYIFSIGFIIFPSMWRYRTKKVDHLFMGTQYYSELQLDWIPVTEVSGFRLSRVHFTGFLFYVLFGVFLKFFPLTANSEFFYWYIFMLFYIAIITLIPIPGTEGYDFFSYSRFAWISAITTVIVGMLCTLIFEDLTYIITVGSVCSIMIVAVYFWKKL